MSALADIALVAPSCGALVGFTLGLVGGGGSVLATPLLLYAVGVAGPHVAIGTGAFAVSLNAFANLAAHARAGHVRWRIATMFAGCGIVGALAGSSLGKLIDGHRLLLYFGLVMAVIGVLMLRPRSGTAMPERAFAQCYHRIGLGGFWTGVAAGFFGIGGGFLIVPALTAGAGLPMIAAVGSSLLAVGCFGLATAANYAASGLVDWPVAGLFVAGGIVGGVGGLALATRLCRQRDLLRRIFGALILIVAGYVIIRAL